MPAPTLVEACPQPQNVFVDPHRRQAFSFESLFPQSVVLDRDEARDGNLASLPPGGGVYAFTDVQGRLIQAACSQSVRRSVRHRLAPPDSSERSARRADLSVIIHAVLWHPTFSVFETTWTYYRIARRLYPGSYRKLVAFGPAWFVHVDPAAAYPRFIVTNRVYEKPGRYRGPFASRADANAFVNRLEDLFDLCRKHDILDQSPHGRACSYFDMGKCPAPCDGTVSAPEYLTQIAQATQYAWGSQTNSIERWREEMSLAASRQDFERAARLKHRMELANQPQSGKSNCVRDGEDFRYLILQRAGGTSWIKPFYAINGWIGEGEKVQMKSIESRLGPWTEQLQLPRRPDPKSYDAVRRAEQVWLVSRFLLRGDSHAGCFVHQSQLSEPRSVLDRVRSAFPGRKAAAAGDIAEDAPPATLTRRRGPANTGGASEQA